MCVWVRYLYISFADTQQDKEKDKQDSEFMLENDEEPMYEFNLQNHEILNNILLYIPNKMMNYQINWSEFFWKTNNPGIIKNRRKIDVTS